MRPPRGHKIDGLHRANRHHPFVPAAVTDNAYRLHRQEHGKGLAGLVIPPGITQLFDKNGIRSPEQIGVFFFYFSQNSHTQAWPRKWMSKNHVARQTQLKANAAYLIFEQLSQGLHQVQRHVLG